MDRISGRKEGRRFLSGHGEMTRLVGDFDWSATPLGPLATWPAPLYHHVNTLLGSAAPLLLVWGPEGIVLYNDAFRELFTAHHPQALGRPLQKTWPDARLPLKPTAVGHAPGSETFRLLPAGGRQEHSPDGVAIPVWTEEGEVAGALILFREANHAGPPEPRSADETLRYRKALLEAQNEAIPDAVLIVDTRGAILSYNKHFAELWLIPQDIIDRRDDHASLAHAMSMVKDPEAFIARVKDCYAHPDVKARDEVEFADGRIIDRWGNAVIGEDGTNYGWVWYFRDVTEQRKAAESLEYQKRLLETVTENTSLALFLMDDRQHCVYMNEAAEEMTGFKLEELQGKQLHYHIHHTHPDGRHYPLEECPIDQALPTQKRMKGEEVFVHRNGTFYTVAFTASPIVVDGKPIGTVIEVRDTTEEKKKQNELKESEYRFRTLADEAPVFIFIGNSDAEIEYINQSWIRFTGLPADQAIGQGWANITHPDDLQRSFDIYNNAFRTRTPYQYEMQQRGHDGQYHWILWTGIPRFLPDGEFIGILGIGTDITEIKRAEAALRESEGKYRGLFTSMDQGFCIVEILLDEQQQPQDYRFVEVNPEFEKQTGLSDVLGKTAREVVPGLEEHWFRIYGEVALTGNAVRFVEGSQVMGRWFDVHAFHLGGEKNRRVAILFTDITEQRKTEEALRQSEEQLRTLSNFLPQIVWSTDPNGYHDFFNKRWYEFTGKSHAETAGEGWSDLLHPDDWQRTADIWQHSLDTGTDYEVEYRMRRHDGEYRWLLARATAFRNERGAITRWFGTCTDIHDQKAMTERLEALVAERTRELQRSNEDLQQFAHVASHDLKEPVRKIRTFSSRLKDVYRDVFPEEANMYISKIEKSADRMYDMIDGILLYSSLDAVKQTAEEVDLDELFRSLSEELELPIAQKGARIEYDPLPTIEGSPILLYQVFYNLVNNSLKFARADRPPVITVSAADVDGAEPDGKELVRVVLQDNGIGFRQSEADRIFQTFSRLNPKDKYEGTGLGLALCKKVVERHGGTIEARGREGEGATFIITLPKHQR